MIRNRQHPADAEPPAPAATFVVGRDSDGHWIAVEARGLCGGYFAHREAALHFAVGETNRRQGAVEFVDAPLVLRL